MTSHKQDDPFSSTALVPSTYHPPTTLARSQQTRQLKKAEQWIVGESHKQQLIIQEQERKAEVAHQAIGAIHESANRAFQAAADDIWETRTRSGRDPVLQRQVDHFAAQTIHSLGGSMQAVTLRSAQAILEETGRSLYRETKEPKGLLALLKGETE